jgi:hypothetical protein
MQINVTLLVILSSLYLLSSCTEDEIASNSARSQTSANNDKEMCKPESIMRAKVIESESGTFLWGGESEDQHFDISDFSLDVCKLNYGIGREHFKALIDPEFVLLDDIKWPIDSTDKAVVIRRSNGNARVYPYSILRAHETINDLVDGRRVAVVLCFLADLAVVYDPTYCNQSLTFAVSGYTYLDQNIQGGLESFVLWDRDTESLWWPIIDKAISGPMKGHGMRYSNDLDWEIMRMYEVEKEFPKAEILKRGQKIEIPVNWPSKSRC